MGVSRYLLPILLCAALLGALLIWAAASAQQPETAKPDGGPTLQGSGTPLPRAAAKSIPGRAPKDVIIGNPCKGPHAPAYCNARD